MKSAPALVRNRILVPAVVLLTTGILLGTVVESGAQYFGRNKIQYENFDWKILNTPHFEIFFYPEEEDLAARAAVIVEDAYQRLSQLFEHELGAQIPFILYASPNDFQQTNIADGLIGEGTGGFSEPMRNRVVLPYPGDNAGFVHVINHELVHVFMFDMVYHSTKAGVARRAWFPVPLWFAEGMAEWFSTGWDQQADMWLRDATIYDWVVPLDRIYGGFQVYKEGQSALRHIARTYGEPKVVELFQAMGHTRDVDKALEQTIGLNTHDFSEEWIKALKKEYWPAYSNKQEPDSIGRRMTDHWKKQAYFFQQPALSPDGRFIAFFSDYDGLVDLYLMDAIDGRVLRKLVTGYRSNRFLTLHSFESSIAFSPDSREVVFVAKSGRDEHLFTVDVESGEVTREIALEMDIARSPDWSPDGDRVVLSGTRGGRTDLYLVGLTTGDVEPVTDDFVDEHSPSWTPDGRRVVYSAHPAATRDIRFEKDPDSGVLRLEAEPLRRPHLPEVQNSFDIWELDLISGRSEVIVSTAGADQDPVAFGDSTVVFVSDLTGVTNLYCYDRGSGVLRRLTDVLGGIFHPAVSADPDRLAFTAFTHAGFDIFLLENFGEFMHRQDFPQLPERDFARRPSPAPRPAEGIADASGGDGALALPLSRPVSLVSAAGLPPRAVAEVAVAERRHRARGGVAAAQPDSIEVGDTGVEGLPDEPLGPEPDVLAPGEIDSLDAAPALPPGERNGRAIGTVEDYHLRFSLDPIGSGYGGVYYTEGLGLGLANVLSLSDMLGNHRMQFLINFYGSIKNSDLAASYYYLKRRVNLAGGVFHYRNFLNSNFTSLGEVFDTNQLFAERNYGFFGLASYPLDQFDRIDLEVQAFVSEKTFYEYDSNFGVFFESGRQSDRLVQPSLSYVHDSAFYGQTGPVTGSRWLASFSPSLPLGGEDVDRVTSFVDYRRYFRLWSRNSLAVRLVGAQSNGGNPRNFVVGGPWTLRGWDTFDFEDREADGSPSHPNLLGRKMLLMNLEYRFPAVDALILGWPGRWGLGGISGVVFFDTGSAFDDRIRFFSRNEDGKRILQDLNADVGFGIRTNLGWLPLKFDWAWKYDLAGFSDSPQFHFSIGPNF